VSLPLFFRGWCRPFESRSRSLSAAKREQHSSGGIKTRLSRRTAASLIPSTDLKGRSDVPVRACDSSSDGIARRPSTTFMGFTSRLRGIAFGRACVRSFKRVDEHKSFILLSRLVFRGRCLCRRRRRRRRRLDGARVSAIRSRMSGNASERMSYPVPLLSLRASRNASSGCATTSTSRCILHSRMTGA
jgi:hypothetical protein